MIDRNKVALMGDGKLWLRTDGVMDWVETWKKILNKRGSEAEAKLRELHIDLENNPLVSSGDNITGLIRRMLIEKGAVDILEHMQSQFQDAIGLKDEHESAAEHKGLMTIFELYAEHGQGDMYVQRAWWAGGGTWCVIYVQFYALLPNEALGYRRPGEFSGNTREIPSAGRRQWRAIPNPAPQIPYRDRQATP